MVAKNTTAGNDTRQVQKSKFCTWRVSFPAVVFLAFDHDRGA